MKLPKIKYEFPDKIRKFAKKEKIPLTQIKQFIEPNLCEDLEDHVATGRESFKIIVTGIRLSDRKMVMTKSATRKKPLMNASAWFSKIRLYYAIFKI